MSVVMVQTKCKLNNAEFFLRLFHIQSKEIGNKKYLKETKELEKWHSVILPEHLIFSIQRWVLNKCWVFHVDS